MLGINLSGAEFGKGDSYGWDYIYPSLKDLSFYAAKGIQLIRLPVRWERLQPTLGGELDKAELGRLVTFLDNAAKVGAKIIVDIHNFGRYDGKAIGSAQVSTADFADFWGKLAGAIGSKSAVYGYDLMNEPHGMPSATAWPDAAQAATDAIRALGDKHTIFVEGESWAGASNWVNDNPYLDVKDALNNIVYEAHVYFDKDGSGTYQGSYDAEKATADVGVRRLKNFVAWLEEKGAKGFIGEFGVPSDDPRWQVALDNFLDKLNEYGLSGTYWGAGSWFNGYNVGLLDKAGKPKASLDTLLDHLGDSLNVGVGAMETLTRVASTGEDVLTGSASGVRMEGGAGDDVYYVTSVGDTVVERVGEGRDHVHAAIDYTLGTSVEDLTLGGAAVNGAGNSRANMLTGNDRDNVLTGLQGDDILDGGKGADRMSGGVGNDTFYIDNPGDTAIENAREGADTVIAKISWTLGANLENLTLTGGTALNGTGNGLDNVITGNGLDNVLLGLAGDDRLSGGAGNDRLEGGADEDRLDGGAGDDILIGGGGRDWLTGGAGRDVFKFSSSSDSKIAGMDRIMDFKQGQDRIDLSAIDASTRSAGDQSFKFIANAGFHKVAGELRYETRDDGVVVIGDLNGDGVGDFQFRVEDVAYRPVASDFIF